jgi:DNA-binding transcriptional MerR regulator/methylmalonyl-CoA mutase cobalamin-binding subunit
MNRTDSLPNSREPRHPIRVAARRAGLTPATLRAWERRYAAVEPRRSEAGQRLYSDADIERLRLIKAASEQGRGASSVAALTNGQLAALVAEDAIESRSGLVDRVGQGRSEVEAARRTALQAIAGLDGLGLERSLKRSCLSLGPQVFVDEILVPVLVAMGEAWVAGEMGPANEHLASGVIRRLLDWLLGSLAPESDGPLLVLGTPAGQVHEFGALLAGIVAADSGWRVAYLGPDLPAAEVARATLGLGASAVALSALRTGTEEAVAEEIRALRAAVPESVPVFVGGPGASGVDDSPAENVRLLADLNGLRTLLRDAPAPQSA